jgi:fatty acid desaturase
MSRQPPDVQPQDTLDSPRTRGSNRKQRHALEDRFRGFTEKFDAIVHQQIGLVKGEIRILYRTVRKGVRLYAGAVLAGQFAFLFLALAALAGLATWIGWGYAVLLLAAFWGIVAAVLIDMGRSGFEDFDGLPDGNATNRETPRRTSSRHTAP